MLANIDISYVFFIKAPNSNNNEDFHEEFPNLCNTLRQCPGKCCSKKALKSRLPILEWLQKYNISTLAYDIVAGISVGLTVIPQGRT